MVNAFDDRQRTSVIVGTYNGARYVQAQLDSLAAQTTPPYEIIVSDDGSVDETVEIVKDFAQRSPIPTTVHCNAKNLGFGENFLQAALRSTGDYVAFCDQDDVWLPHKIEKCQEALMQPGVVLVVHAAGLIDSVGAPLGIFTQGIIKSAVRPPLYYGPWDVFFGFSMVFDFRLLTLVPPKLRGIDYIVGDRKLAHDRWIGFLANLVGNTSEIAEPLVEYRQHGNNLFGYGSIRKWKKRAQVAAESDIYLRSAREQRDIVDVVASSALTTEIDFNHDEAVTYWDAAVAQQWARNQLYHAGSLPAESSQWLRNLGSGIYRTLPDRRPRLMAALKDAKFVIDGVRTVPRLLSLMLAYISSHYIDTGLILSSLEQGV